MHKEANSFVKSVKQKHGRKFFGCKVLEVGSLNINGSVRKYFWWCKYTGIDLQKGRGVDRVISIHELDEPATYDTVISTEMLEHDKHWEESLLKMYSNTKEGGLLVITCASTKRKEHGTIRTSPKWSPFTTDYYRNISPEDLQGVLPRDFFSDYHIELGRQGKDLYFYGIKKTSKTEATKKMAAEFI